MSNVVRTFEEIAAGLDRLEAETWARAARVTSQHERNHFVEALRELQREKDKMTATDDLELPISPSRGTERRALAAEIRKELRNCEQDALWQVPARCKPWWWFKDLLLRAADALENQDA